MTSPETIARIVARNADMNPTAIAFAEASSDTAASWREYDERSSRMAAALSVYEPGDRIALKLTDGPDAHIAMLACEKAGLVAVGIGARAGDRETAHIVDRTGARILFTVPPPEAAAPVRELRTIGPSDLWFLPPSSEKAQRIGGLTADDVFLSALPTPFGFGLWTAHVTPAIVGAPCIVLERFSPEAVLAAIERYRVTVLAAVSTQFVMMLNSRAFDAYDHASLRLMFTGGEMVPFERAQEFETRTNAYVLQFYGSNETGALSATSPDDSQEKRLGTAGRLIPEMQVRLLDPDTGADVEEVDRPGVPAGRGPTLCLGYWNDEVANRELFTTDGWMRMGDLATIDDDGYLNVVGRSSDFIIRGGKNVSAAQVEAEVASHPSVALCAAVPVPDEVFGERVCVFVELRAGEPPLVLDDLRAHLDARGTSKELWPERLEILDALPRSSGGKVAKGELRNLVWSERGRT